jgi:hypothetical protein
VLWPRRFGLACALLPQILMSHGAWSSCLPAREKGGLSSLSLTGQHQTSGNSAHSSYVLSCMKPSLVMRAMVKIK